LAGWEGRQWRETAFWDGRNARLELQAPCGFDNVEGEGLGRCLKGCVPCLVEIVWLGEVIEVPQQIFQLQSSLLDGG
jgi:hypothetical protein